MSAIPPGAASAQPLDLDSQETREWMDALSAVIQNEGPERAHFLLGAVAGARPPKQH
jgi:pyruvate dehydrogenase E1 component